MNGSYEFFTTLYAYTLFAGNDAKDTTPVKGESPEKDKKSDKRKVNKPFVDLIFDLNAECVLNILYFQVLQYIFHYPFLFVSLACQ